MFMDKKFVQMRDGTELYVEVKETGSPVWIVALHGIGEHLGRHKYIPEMFGHDFNIFQYDLRGHGRSMGRRAYVSDFSLYMEDLKEIISFLQEKYRMNRYILFGHSMGALISCAFMQNYVQEAYYPERFVINAPPCGAHGVLGTILKLVPAAFLQTTCDIPYSLPIGGLVDLEALSHDSRVKEDYMKDSLNSLKLESKLLFELMKCAQATFSRPIRARCPSFITVGGSDRVIGVADDIAYFSHVEKAFNLKVIDGAYHEIHNEIEKYRRPYLDHLKMVFEEVLFKEKK